MVIRNPTTAIWAMAVFFVLGTLFVRAVFVYFEYEDSVRNAKAASQHLVRLTEEYVRRTIQTADLVAEQVEDIVAASGGIEGVEDAEVKGQLARLARKTVGSYILVIAPDGTPVATSLTYRAPDVNLRDRAYFQAHLAGADLVVGPAIYSRLSDEVLFTVSQAIRRADGTLAGVIQIAIPPTFFYDAVSGERYANEMVGLWTPTGEVVGWTALTRDTIGFRLGPQDLPKILARDSGTFLDDFVGERRIIAYSQVGQWPLVVTGSVPLSDATAAVVRSLQLTAVIVLPLVLGLAGLTYVGVRRTQQQDVLGADLARANAELRDARDALQERVAQRTSELADSVARLSESDAKIRAVFNSTFGFMMLLDRDGRIVELNKAAVDLIGLPGADLVGMALWDLPIFGEEGSYTGAQIRQAVEQARCGHSLRLELKLWRNGRRVVADYVLKPICNDAGEIVSLLSEGRDISDMREAQERLHETQKLESLGQLTGGVAHDFNNLLMAVAANLEILRKAVGRQPDLLRLIDLSQQGVARGATLTQRLLAFARRQELAPAPFDVGGLFVDLESLIRPTMTPSISLRFLVPDDLPPVLADRGQTELAILNLCLNARDAMPQGGTITIQARRGGAADRAVGQGRAGAADFVCIAVEDDGAGMDAATLQRATEPFFTTKGPGKGSGLGLSMVHGLAAQSGGAFFLRSSPKAGTAAELWLPVAPTAAAGEARPAAL
ncbi:MAG: PAS domain S-box protein, partial [Caenispirillum sp.]|nr:PAS domain S-box protein [Caenispirillum sp.]